MFELATDACMDLEFHSAKPAVSSNGVMVLGSASKEAVHCFLQTINFQFQAYVLAQGITKPIGAANVASMIICACISGWLVENLQFGILVFPVCKVIMEICNM